MWPDIKEDPNTPAGKYASWQRRDKNIYCWRHPNIHPDNEEKIKYMRGSTYKRNGDGKIIELIEFDYCPKCYLVINRQVSQGLDIKFSWDDLEK